MVVGGAFGVAGRQVAELFEPVEAAFDDVALFVAFSVECGRPPREPFAARCAIWSSRSGQTMRMRRRRPHRFSGGGVGVGLVQDHRLGAASWPARPFPLDTDPVEQRHELELSPAWPGVSRIRIGRPRPSTARWDLGTQSASGSAEVLPGDGDGFDGFAGGAPFFRAPAACWWARTTEESTEITHSTSPTASSLTITSSRTFCHNPVLVYKRSRSCAVFHGPYRSGRSRHDAPARNFHKIALST